MPYRRLPTTDKARIRALESALQRVESVHVRDIPFSKHSIEELVNFKNQFEYALKQYEFDTEQERKNAKLYKVARDTARMYLSHFIQVLLFAAERGEINGGIKFYGPLKDLKGKVPSLQTEAEILEWGKIMVEGEQNRIRQGGSAIYSPSIALVKIKLQEFEDAVVYQTNLKRNTARSFDKMQKLRKQTNNFIAQLWDEIEMYFEQQDPERKQELAAEYGIVYVLRRSERKRLEEQRRAQAASSDFIPKKKEDAKPKVQELALEFSS